MATLVAAVNLAPELCILPNLAIHNINFPHDRDAQGTWIQNKAVTTKVRVGLQAVTLPVAPMHVTISLHTASGEITADAVKSLGYSTYGNLASTSLQLRNSNVLPAAESDGGVARAGCVAEATFCFKFGVTAAQISGLDKDTRTDTPVWLRFTVAGSPDLYVETPSFRLVARNCPSRNPKAQKLVLATQKLIKQVPSREEQSS